MSEPTKRTAASESPETERLTEDLFDGSARSAERMDRVLSLLRNEWLAHPDERFWQMTANLAERLGISSYARILEDDSFIDMLEQHARSSGRRSDKYQG
ncbi:DUF1040 family protein [Arthrobacter sp. 131MFCol6.1]|uniref:DUF1040 family protein n=1 Tax=Arthrobacter sp. 131MFCol6.1 TaxID=1157944 RepID=UPI0012DE3D1A|nr:DUF1040 family protein [Arthrobacter sp. 131MFCol6.1]